MGIPLDPDVGSVFPAGDTFLALQPCVLSWTQPRLLMESLAQVTSQPDLVGVRVSGVKQSRALACCHFSISARRSSGPPKDG